MTKEEALILVSRLSNIDGTEEDLRNIRVALREALPNSSIHNMIYFPDIERSPEEIVEEAFRRAEAPKLALPPPKA